MLGAGSAAPGFRLGPFDLEAAGEPVLLVFFKVNCPTCQLAAPYLQRLADRGGPRVVGISQNDAEDTAEFNKAFGVRFETVPDPAPAYTVSNAYGLTHVPSLFLVEPDGRIGWVGEGFSKPDLSELASRWGVTLFEAGDRAPAFKPG